MQVNQQHKKEDPTLFTEYLNEEKIYVLAHTSIHGTEPVRLAAFKSLKQTCPTPLELFYFCEMREKLGGGWGRGMVRAVAAWYNETPLGELAQVVISTPEAFGWSHRDLLRLAHPNPNDTNEDDITKGQRDDLYKWIVGRWGSAPHPVPLVRQYQDSLLGSGS